MSRTIYDNLEHEASRVMNSDGKCIHITDDGDSESTQVTVILHDADEATELMIALFSRFPELIAKTLAAASIVMDGMSDIECDEDCKDGLCLN